MRISNALYNNAVAAKEEATEFIERAGTIVSGIDEEYGEDLVNVTMVAVLNRLAGAIDAYNELLDIIITHGKEERSLLN